MQGATDKEARWMLPETLLTAIVRSQAEASSGDYMCSTSAITRVHLQGVRGCQHKSRLCVFGRVQGGIMIPDVVEPRLCCLA
jgi:hypothetical protein